MVEHAVGFIILPVVNVPAGPEVIHSLNLVTTRQGGWLSRILATRHGSPEEVLELEVADAARDLLQAAGRAIHDHRLPYELRLLPAAQSTPIAAAAEPAADQAAGCVQLVIGLLNMLLQGVGWRRSPAAALLLKQLVPMDTDLGAAMQQACLGPTACSQQHQGASDSSGPAPGRYTLLSCFKELPSASTAPPPQAISVTETTQQQNHHQQQQQQQQAPAITISQHGQSVEDAHTTSSVAATTAAASTQGSSSSSSSSLADVPCEVMNQLFRLLSAADLASLACCCKGLRWITWDAVPGMKLTLYPHQRNALGWMLHREVHGGGVINHPFIVKFVTNTGVPVYLNQVTGEISAEPPPPINDIRGGFFCDEPGLGKTVTALSLILKTQGVTPQPPPAANVTWIRTPIGKKVGFYTPGDSLGPAVNPSVHLNLGPSDLGPGGSLQPGSTLQQQHGTAAAAGVQENGRGVSPNSNLGRSGNIRRSGSYSGSAFGLGHLAGVSSTNRSQVRQGAWALAPSLRSSSSRRRARSEAAAAELAAAAAVAAASAVVESSFGSRSSRKRKVPSDTAAMIAIRAAGVDVVTTQGIPKAAAAAAAAAAAPRQDSAAAPNVTNDDWKLVAAAAVAATLAPVQWVPARAAAMKATAKIRDQIRQNQSEPLTQQCCQQQQQQQQRRQAAANHADERAKGVLQETFTPVRRAARDASNKITSMLKQEDKPHQQQQQPVAVVRSSAAGRLSDGVVLSPRRQAAMKAANSIHQLYCSVEGDEGSSDAAEEPTAAAAAAGGGTRSAGRGTPHVVGRSTAAAARANPKGSSSSHSDADDVDGSFHDSDYVSCDDSLAVSSGDDSESDHSTRNRKRNRRRSSWRQQQQQHGSKQRGAKQQQQRRGPTAAEAAICPAADSSGLELPAAKRLKLETKQQQQGSDGSDGSESSAGVDSNWVMCDHCSKWRLMPAEHKVDPDLPWFCCLHPNSDLASCLAPEEQHDGNNKSHNVDTDGNMKYSYKSMPGFVQQQQDLQQHQFQEEPDTTSANVAHFTAVINSSVDVGDPLWVQQLLWWLAGQSTDVLVTSGLIVPREIVKSLPAYGRILTLMSLQVKATAAAATGRKRRDSSKIHNTPANKPATETQTAVGNQTSDNQQQQQQRKSLPALPSSPMFQQQQLAAARKQPHDDDDDEDYNPAAEPTAAAATAAAAPVSSSRRGKASGSSRGVGYSAAAHTWVQPPACETLRFDVAALRAALDQSAAAAAKPRMFLSSATLVIVPVTLIPHWQQQIRQHLLPRRLRVIVLGSAAAISAGTDTAAAGSSSSRAGSSSKASSTAAGGGGAAETVCPPAHELAWNYDIVITTFNRLSSDWSLRSDPRLAERMVLLKVHWLRVLIDEGHSLGASLGLTNKLAMAVQLTAERRWVMTGTPTPATAAGSGAAHLQPLLSFLHHQPFGSSRAAWDGAVAKPLEAAAATAAASSSSKGLSSGASLLVAEWGRQQLLKLLGRVMIRSCKADLALLPPCYKKVTLLDFGSDHAQSYNALIEVIRRNLLLADWCDDAHYESLLNPKQARWAKEMLSNVRLACCVAGAMNLVPKEEDVQETLELLAGRLELPQPAKEQHIVPETAPPPTPAAAAVETEAPPPPAAAAVAGPLDDVSAGVVLRQRWFFTGPGHPLHPVEDALRNGCRCQVCGDVTHLPMVTPCAHLLCTDCTAVSRTSCPVPACQLNYNMQAKNDPARYKNNPDPKWEVPLDLIEWQPVFHQIGATGLSGGQWSANWRITRSTKVLHLIRRLIEIKIYQPQGLSTAARLAAAVGGPVRGCLRGPGSSAAAAAAGLSSSKAPPVKAIIFSQFWMHIQLIAAEFAARGVCHVFLKKDMPARDKQAAVTAFRNSSSSSCLVMDESGALGLDLSFVRYIFLMEPIADAALEQQVVSRAHRMGAAAPVHVEVLAMKHTAEEHLVALRHQAASGKLSSSAADAAASQAAAAVAGADKQQQQQQDGQNGRQEQQQPHVQQLLQEEEELGGASAAAAAVDITNISNFIAVGGGGNQMDSRGLRNLLLLHLRKVVVADLPDLPEHLEDAAAAAAAAAAAGFDGFDAGHVGWRGGRGNLLQAEGNTGRTAAAASSSAAAMHGSTAAATVAAGAAGVSGVGGAATPVESGNGLPSSGAAGSAAASPHAMWGDFAVQRRQSQQQQQQSELPDDGEEEAEEDTPDHPSQQHMPPAKRSTDRQQHQARPRVQFTIERQEDGQARASAAPLAAGDALDGDSAAAAARAGREKPVKRARFADDV